MTTPAISVFRRKDSRWWWASVTIPGPGGRSTRIQQSLRPLKVSLDTHTRAEATARAKLYFQEHLPEPGAGMTLRQFRDWCSAQLDIEPIADSTRRCYLLAIDSLIDAIGGAIDIGDIRKSHIAQYKTHRLDNGVTPQCINSDLSEIRALFSRAVDREMIPANPFYRLKKLRETSSGLARLSVEQLDAFFRAVDAWEPFRCCRPRLHYKGLPRIVRIYLYTARRRREILEIPREDIDTANWRMAVANIKRSDKARMVIDIPPAIREHVAWFIEHGPRRYPFGWYKPDYITKFVRARMDDAGIPKHLHLHSLRHTALSMAVERGENLRRIQEFVGHSTISVTEGYLHTVSKGSIDIGYNSARGNESLHDDT